MPAWPELHSLQATSGNRPPHGDKGTLPKAVPGADREAQRRLCPTAQALSVFTSQPWEHSLNFSTPCPSDHPAWNAQALLPTGKGNLSKVRGRTCSLFSTLERKEREGGRRKTLCAVTLPRGGIPGEPPRARYWVQAACGKCQTCCGPATLPGAPVSIPHPVALVNWTALLLFIKLERGPALSAPMHGDEIKARTQPGFCVRMLELLLAAWKPLMTLGF